MLVNKRFKRERLGPNASNLRAVIRQLLVAEGIRIMRRSIHEKRSPGLSKSNGPLAAMNKQDY
jgi:hypothetical protein